MDRMPAEDIILDSGAHTFFSSSGMSVHGYKVTRKMKNDLSRYHSDYLVFLKKNWDRFDYFVELDVADLFGMDIVRAMRDDYMKAGMWDKCIMGWHPINGEDDYQWMLDNTGSGWVAIEGNRIGVPLIKYNNYIRPAYERGIKVHGFALMSDKLLRAFPFYSVDCASWLVPVMYGKQPTWTGDHITMIEMGRDKRGDAIKRLTSPQRKLRASIEAYRKAEAYYTDYWKAKGIDWDEQVKKWSRNRNQNDSGLQAQTSGMELQTNRNP
jgi:hypothetical protein